MADHYKLRPLAQISIRRMDEIKSLGNVASVPTNFLVALVPIMAKLYAEEKWTGGDEMRDAAQLIDELLRQAEFIPYSE